MPYTKYIGLDKKLKDSNTIFCMYSKPLDIPYLKLKIYIVKRESKYSFQRKPRNFFQKYMEAFKKAVKAFKAEVQNKPL